MSRYVHLQLALVDLAAIEAALTSLSIAYERGPVLLRGTLECAGEPVLLRIDAGPWDTTQDCGFVRNHDGSLALVCGDLDRSRLEQRFLPALTAEHARIGIERAAAHAGLELESTQVDVHGRRRIILRTRAGS